MRALLTCAALMAAMPAMGGEFDGVFKQGPEWDCGLAGVDGGALVIKDGIFHGVEMECRMENPVDVRDMDAYLYDMECSGGGSAWSARALPLRYVKAAVPVSSCQATVPATTVTANEPSVSASASSASRVVLIAPYARPNAPK